MDTGTTIGNYTLVNKLGEGGMGVVYSAKDERLGRTVAIKFLPETLAEEPDSLERFEREARAASAINHANLCTIHDIGDHLGRPYLVMELLDGQTLKELAQSGPVEIDTLVDISAQLAAALDAAHDNNIIHRDVKPANIMMTGKGTAKLLDFGLAKLNQETLSLEQTMTIDHQSRTQPGVVMGTIAYMSPEQARGEELDNRSDLFSLGVVLYELATGENPFENPAVAVTFASILSKDPPPPSQSNPKIPRALDVLILKLLEKEKEQRYQSAAEFQEDLKMLNSDSITQLDSVILKRVEELTAGSSVQNLPTDNRQRNLLIAVLAVLVVVLGVVLLSPSGDDPPESPENNLASQEDAAVTASDIRSMIVLPLDEIGGKDDEPYFADGMTVELITGLSKLDELRVISRTSSMQYRGTKMKVSEIAQEVNVDGVLSGIIQRSDASIRVSLELVSANSGGILWSESFDYTPEDLLKIQSEVTTAVASEIEIALSSEVTADFADVRQVDPRAHDAYMHAEYYRSRADFDGILNGIDYYKKAIEIDEEYAEAHAMLSYGYATSWGWNIQKADEVIPLARKHAERAQRLNPKLGTAYSSLSSVCYMEHRWTEAEIHSERAVELAPENTTVLENHSWTMAGAKKFDEAILTIRKVIAMDPLNTHAKGIYLNHLVMARRWGEAEKEAKAALEIDQNYVPSMIFLGQMYLYQDKLDEAIAQFENVIQIGGESADMDGFIAQAKARKGNFLEAEELLKNLQSSFDEESADVSCASIASALIGFNRLDEAVEWIQRAVDRKEWISTVLATEPDLAPLKDHPDFVELVNKVNGTERMRRR